ncbi:glycosyltransferase [Chitinophaga sp.]|uniref:glycosyltransferase family 2 protein n=1 Tax=Chitinophaga sp. TaxID=1869181 RepID=UPI0031E35429
MKISVVIPTYRRPHLLSACLEALSGQDLDKDEFEVIVVSDGPDVATRKVMDTWYQKRRLDLRYIPLNRKKGPAAARNKGWKAAVAPLIAFTDDDTLPDSRWLSSFLNAWDGHQAMAFTGKVVVPVSKDPTDYERNTARLATADFVTANCAVAKVALAALHGFDERFSIAWREDSDLEFRLLALKVPVVKIPDAVVVHPVRKAEWGVSIKEQKKNMYNALLYKKFPDMYRRKIQRRPAWNYYAMIAMILLAAVCFAAGWMVLVTLCMLCWLVVLGIFISKRLADTTHRRSHVVEMIITSVAIPFVAIYWSLYGAWRYKVFFL